MKIDVTQIVTDLRSNPLPLDGAGGHLSRILGTAVTVPADGGLTPPPTMLRDVIETILVLTPPDQTTTQPLDDKRKAYKLAQRVAHTDVVELSPDEKDLLQRRGGQFLPVIEFGFLDDVLERTYAEAVLAEQQKVAAPPAAVEPPVEEPAAPVEPPVEESAVTADVA